VFPADRLPRLISYLMDVKLELYYLLEIDIHLQNRYVYGHGYQVDKPREKPNVLLARLSLDQTLILKSRVLWDRLMNALFYLQTGLVLEDRKGAKSKKSRFFKEMFKCERWQFLSEYEPQILQYDDDYRTPESHKMSVLRAQMMKGTIADPNRVTKLLNSATGLWRKIVAVVDGRKPTEHPELPSEQGEIIVVNLHGKQCDR